MLYIWQKIRINLFTYVIFEWYNTYNFTRKDGAGYMMRRIKYKEEIFG